MICTLKGNNTGCGKIDGSSFGIGDYNGEVAVVESLAVMIKGEVMVWQQ